MATKIDNLNIIQKVLDQGLYDVGIMIPKEHTANVISVLDVHDNTIELSTIEEVEDSLYIPFSNPISALAFHKQKFINTVKQTKYIVLIDNQKIVIEQTVIFNLDKFKENVFIQDDYQIPYRLFKPKEDNNLHPLVIFLHGSGERGNDNLMQLVGNKGAVKFIEYDFQEQHTCYVLAPQAPLKDYLNHCWIEDNMPKYLMMLIKKIVSEYPIDKKRIYIEGMSNGGSGVYKMIYDYPNYFAAAIVMCGIVDTTSLEFTVGNCNKGNLDNVDMNRLIQTPIYICHDQEDPLVDVGNSIDIYNRIKIANHAYLYLTNGLKHACWIEVLNNSNILNWLMNQERK